jgi:serine/threonine-protein kinase PknG
VSATDARQLIDTLSPFQQKSIEIQLCKCRAHLELADFEKAHECLGTAEEFLGEAADYDWRVAWHHGLLALANDKSIDAVIKFAEVYRALPGEDAPKLALGFCYEQMDKPDDTQHYAQHYYEAVWLRDRSQASAAFGLARIYLRRGNRNDAVTILDEVPNVSRHYDAARIAAVRILSGRLDTSTGNGNGLPTVADYKEVVSRLPALYLDGGDKDGAARGRLTAAVREVALDWICKTEGDTQFNGKDVLGHHVSEQGLRELLEKSFRALAGQARNLNDHGALVDLANEVRPWTPR